MYRHNRPLLFHFIFLSVIAVIYVMIYLFQKKNRIKYRYPRMGLEEVVVSYNIKYRPKRVKKMNILPSRLVLIFRVIENSKAYF